QSARVLHLEGPFLNPHKRVAHPAELIVSPSVELITDLLDTDEGAVIIMTFAPEQFDAESINLLLQRSILLSAGHSAASFGQAMQGFDGGIKAATHRWNAMSSFHHRDIGLPGAVFRHSGVSASILVDGRSAECQAR